MASTERQTYAANLMLLSNEGLQFLSERQYWLSELQPERPALACHWQIGVCVDEFARRGFGRFMPVLWDIYETVDREVRLTA